MKLGVARRYEQLSPPSDLSNWSERFFHDLLEFMMPRQMTNAERWRAIGMLEGGMSYREVGRHFGRSHNTIRSLHQKVRASGSVVHQATRHNRRQTTARADRRLLRLVRANPTLPATLFRLLWNERNRRGNILSAQTVRRRIKETALRSRKMRKVPRLSPVHVVGRERWAMQRVHWRVQQWRRVIFTDECRFRLFRSDGRIRVWREPRQELLRENVQVCDRQAQSLHVWAGISLTGKTELVFLQHNVTANTYGDLLQRHLVPYMNRVFGGTANCILQDDNAPPHRAAAVRQLKDHLQIRTLRWPSRSPDMNPIEHVWSALKRRISTDNPPQNLAQLQQQLQDAWTQLPQDFIQRLILGMPRRINSLLLARGGYTRY